MAKQVLDLDRDVVAQGRVLLVERPDDRDRVADAVPEIRIAERDVRGARRDLAAHVLEHHLARHHPEPALVDRHDRTMTAEMLAATRRLGVADVMDCAVRNVEMGVALERRQPATVGRHEAQAIVGDQGWRGGNSRAGPRAGDLRGQSDQSLLELPADHELDAQASQVLAVHRRIETVGGIARAGMSGAHHGQRARRDPGGGVHRQVEGDQVRGPHPLEIQLLDREIEAVDLEAGLAQPRGGGCQAEGLAAHVVGGNEQHAHGPAERQPATGDGPPPFEGR